MQISIVLSYAFLGLFNAFEKGGKAVKNTKKTTARLNKQGYALKWKSRQLKFIWVSYLLIPKKKT